MMLMMLIVIVMIFFIVVLATGTDVNDFTKIGDDITKFLGKFYPKLTGKAGAAGVGEAIVVDHGNFS